MMRALVRWSGVIGLLCGTCVAGSARAAFEDIEVCPRARGLGGSWAALRLDAFAPFHNPAALAWTPAAAAAASYVRPFGYDFSSQNVVAAALPLPRRLGGMGLGWRSFGVEYLGERLTSESTVSLAHGFHLLADRQSELAVGWMLSAYTLDYGRSLTGIDPGRATALGVGLGAQAVVRERTRVGLQALNLNNPTIGERDKEELRRRVTVGVSYSPYPGVETVLDMDSELGEELQYRGGAEFEVAEFLRLRAGIRTAPNSFAAGFGVRHAGVSLEYGFSTGGGVLSETHQFGLAVRLPEPR
jgi:hypothetical protein